MARWGRRVARVLGFAGAACALRAVEAVSIGEMAEAGAEDLAEIPALISIVIYIAGVVFLSFGIVKLKRANDSSRDQRLGGALMTLAVGVGLVALPSVFEGISETFGVSDSATIDKPSLE